MDSIIIVGNAKGKYINEAVTKEFSGKLLAVHRPDDSLIIHDLRAGVRPLCYIQGALISICRNKVDNELEIFANTEDGQELLLEFTEIIATEGVPEVKKQINKVETATESAAMAILRCVFEVANKYGRSTIARILIGEVPKNRLLASVPAEYGMVKDSSFEEVGLLIDWLIEENYLAYAMDTEFPLLIITTRGLDILAGGDELPVEEGHDPGQFDTLQESEADDGSDHQEVDEISQDDLEAAAELYDKIAAKEKLVQDYLETNGTSCPYCDSVRLSADPMEIDGDDAYCNVECLGCKKTWRDLYKLVGFEGTFEGGT